MGSSKASSAKKRELSDHALTLRQRLHEALSLGIRFHDKKGRKWQCMDAEIQSHALRTMSAFIDCISSAMLQHPLIKDSISDMLVALEGIIQSENGRILSLATNVTVKIVSCLGTSISHYHVLEVIISLSHLLSSHQLSIAISSAIALNRILTKLGRVRYDNQKDFWKAVEKTNAVSSVVCALQDYVDGVQPPEYFTEMASLLKTILWKWPSSRYLVWSNSKLMAKLGDIFPNPNTSIATGILQLYSALALCGDGAMMILESKERLSKMVQGMGILQPYSVRYESLLLCQHLTRSATTCSKLTSLYCEPVVQGIISAMGGWRSCSEKVPSDQMPLLMEACRTALMTRWAGNHHSYFWKLEIDKVLLDILLGDCNTIYQNQVTLFPEELIAKIYDNKTEARSYIWDILGWLAIHCEEDFLPKTKGKLCYLDILISCACSVAKDLMRKGGSSLSPHTSEIEPVSRTVLLMLFSPCKYVASQAKYYLSEVARTDGDEYLDYLLASLKLNAAGNVSLVSDNLQTVINLAGLACYSTLPQYQKLIIERKGIHILFAIIKSCLKSNIHFSRSNIVSHLHSSSDGRTCCWNHVEDWDGGDIHLLYSLQALSQLILFSGFVCNHHNMTTRCIAECKVCENVEGRGLVDILQYILCSSFSPGVKWYAAYILSFFGFYGFPSKLGERMKRALDENEVADLQLILANGQILKVHCAILVSRCPYLLPPKQCLKERTCDVGSTAEQDIEQHRRRFRDEVRMSDRVDKCALIKILEYIYTGTLYADDELLKPLKILAKCCGLKFLSDMLYQKLPIWGTAGPSCDFTGALRPTGHMFSDIILEAKATEGLTSDCSLCQFSMPHMHAHKIILWSSCDYLRALFQSGMHDSYSQIIKVPIGWLALVRLVHWFYSGKLPRISPGCGWNNMDPEQQLVEMQAYVELASLAEYWFLEEVGEESANVVISSLKSNQRISIEIIQFAADLGQWKIVEAAVSNIAPLYPKLRDAGNFENLDEAVVEMLRAEYVRHSQESTVRNDRTSNAHV